jgi:predicted amidohydrolase YtcJ
LSIRLALRAAIDAYTSTTAFASFDEAEKGTLAPGQLADFVVLATGVFTRVPRTAADLAAATTVFGGKVVYERPAN